MQDIFLRSGKWRWSVVSESAHRGEVLELLDPAFPQDKMTVSLPFSWRNLSREELAEIAREPEVRMWTDELGIPWRISRVGPGTHYPYNLGRPHLFFDSERAYSGLVPLDPGARLGDLNRGELSRYRNRIRDFGARRTAFRPPIALSA